MDQQIAIIGLTLLYLYTACNVGSFGTYGKDENKWGAMGGIFQWQNWGGEGYTALPCYCNNGGRYKLVSLNSNGSIANGSHQWIGNSGGSQIFLKYGNWAYGTWYPAISYKVCNVANSGLSTVGNTRYNNLYQLNNASNAKNGVSYYEPYNAGDLNVNSNGYTDVYISSSYTTHNYPAISYRACNTAKPSMNTANDTYYSANWKLNNTSNPKNPVSMYYTWSYTPALSLNADGSAQADYYGFPAISTYEIGVKTSKAFPTGAISYKVCNVASPAYNTAKSTEPTYIYGHPVSIYSTYTSSGRPDQKITSNGNVQNDPYSYPAISYTACNTAISSTTVNKVTSSAAKEYYQINNKSNPINPVTFYNTSYEIVATSSTNPFAGASGWIFPAISTYGIAVKTSKAFPTGAISYRACNVASASLNPSGSNNSNWYQKPVACYVTNITSYQQVSEGGSILYPAIILSSM